MIIYIIIITIILICTFYKWVSGCKPIMIKKKDYSNISIFDVLKSSYKKRYWIKNISNFFRYDISNFLKLVRGRIIYGYGPTDTWSMDSYLAGIISRYLATYNDCPCSSPIKISEILKDVQEGLAIYRDRERFIYWITNVLPTINDKNIDEFQDIFAEIDNDFSAIIKHIKKLSILSSYYEYKNDYYEGLDNLRIEWNNFTNQLSDDFYLVYQDSDNLSNSKITESLINFMLNFGVYWN